jgi:hypothetical protein
MMKRVPPRVASDVSVAAFCPPQRGDYWATAHFGRAPGANPCRAVHRPPLRQPQRISVAPAVSIAPRKKTTTPVPLLPACPFFSEWKCVRERQRVAGGAPPVAFHGAASVRPRASPACVDRTMCVMSCFSSGSDATPQHKRPRSTAGGPSARRAPSRIEQRP